MPLNGLAGASSPYLLQHATNPVDWLVWSEDALARAKAEDKPILLSVGYAACHWCHVMAHESFEDSEIAAVINAHFISIKVDREERPDLDSIYMNALSAMGEQGGWPLTMFLTPEGTPFFGGTYFPPDSRWGRPGFRQVLEAIAKAWREEREKIATGSAALFRRLAAPGTAPVGEAPEPTDLTAVTDRYLQAMDWQDGGLGGAPKFPSVPIFRFLWSEHVRTGRHEAAAAVGLMLGRMAQGGIYDHLGGGFARYATDAEWLVPHFEKMLYDNALLLELIALAYAVEPDPLLAARSAETVEWMLREMRADEDRDAEGRSAFAASLDADSEGEEGRFYVWTRAELEAALGADFPRFAEHYPCPEAGNWEGKIILTRPERPESVETERELAALRARLLALRDQRVRPGRDDKILADWNGMAITALARAAGIFGRSDWLAAAREAFEAVGALLRAGDGRYDHAYRRGQVSATGLLDDQAAMLGATLALYEATGEAALLEDASRLAAATDAHFADTRGGFHLSADDATDLPGGFRPHGDTDGPTPSGAGMMAEARARLWHLTGDETHRDRARQIVATVTGERRALPAYPTMLVAAALLDEAQTVVIAGDPADPGFATLHAEALAHLDPLTVILPVGDTDGLPSSHPAQGKSAERPAAFVCRGATCGLPVFTPEDLAEALRRPAAT